MFSLLESAEHCTASHAPVLSSAKDHLANLFCRHGRTGTPDLCVLLPPCLRASRGFRLSGPAEAGSSGGRFRSVLSGQPV